MKKLYLILPTQDSIDLSVWLLEQGAVVVVSVLLFAWLLQDILNIVQHCFHYFLCFLIAVDTAAISTWPLAIKRKRKK